MSQIATRYAEAFFSLASDLNKVAEFKKDMDFVKDSLGEIEGARKFFVSAQVSKNDKKNVLTSCFEGKIDTYTLNFLCVLVDKGRIGNYKEIAAEFHNLCNQELGIREGIIESARPIEEEKIKLLEETLSKEGQKVELVAKINESLISGFRITFDNEVIDGSMKTKIEKMNDMLLRKDVNLWS